MNTYRGSSGDVLVKVLFVLFLLAIFAVAFAVRLAITGGDVGCTFSQDPALCVAVKEGVR